MQPHGDWSELVAFGTGPPEVDAAPVKVLLAGIDATCEAEDGFRILAKVAANFDLSDTLNEDWGA